MSALTSVALASWRVDLGLLSLLGTVAACYAVGFTALRRRDARSLAPWRGGVFFAGLVVLLASLGSPLDTLSGLSLPAHMVQHWLLTMVAPPLLLLGAPFAPLLRGLPGEVRRDLVAPLLASRRLRRVTGVLAHPALAWPLFTVTIWIWHLPAAYELALREPSWHRIEHLCFFGTALLFWWPVVLPWPAREVWPRAAMIPYLVLADLQNTAFSALFAFSDRRFYASDATAPLAGSSPLADQASAGALMWLLGSAAFLLPIGLLVHEILAPAQPQRRPRARALPGARVRRGFDALQRPFVGRWLRSLSVRRSAQGAVLVLAALVIGDGLLGPRMSPMNAAGTLPWIWWRGLVVAALLGAGSAFCFACPFVLVRDAARRWLPSRRAWPRRLRSKWLAAGLLATLLVVSEVFGVWDDPRATAVLVLGYFGAALAVDGVFRGASFCKYLCPLGQFQFLAATLSPLTVKVRSGATCRTCTSQACIRGGPTGRGCETALFVPAKTGNLDCTFCLDCVRACPYDNVGLLRATPGRELADDSPRSSIGRVSSRPDLAALSLVFVAGAFTSAAAMIAPTGAVVRSLAGAVGSRALAEALLLLAGIAVAPALAIAACSACVHRLGRTAGSRTSLASRLSLALVPLGFTLWASHFLFHFATAATSVVPVMQRIASQTGLALLGAPDWRLAQAGPSGDALLALEILLLDLGLLLTLRTAWRIVEQTAGAPHRRLAGFVPFGLLATGLWILGLWILVEPMAMRGTMVHG